MKINRIALLEALTLVQPGLAGSEVIEQSASFVFSGDAISTFNDEIAVSIPFESGINGAVKSQELLKILNRSPEEEVDVTASENEFRMKGKRSVCGIKMESEVTLPLSEIGEAKKMNRLPANFVEALKFCLFSASANPATPVLGCIHCCGGFVESCDNFRITRHTLKTNMKDEILVPAAAAQKLGSYQPDTYGVSDGWIHFRGKGGVLFACRTFSEAYPSLDETLAMDEGVEIEFPDETKEMLDRAGIFSQTEFKEDEKVSITLGKNVLMITGQGASGWYKERAKVEFPGDPFTFMVNSAFMKDTLGLLKKAVVGENRIKMMGEGFEHLVLLMNDEVPQGE